LPDRLPPGVTPEQFHALRSQLPRSLSETEMGILRAVRESMELPR
jgi:hypothetical protein